MSGAGNWTETVTSAALAWMPSGTMPRSATFPGRVNQQLSAWATQRLFDLYPDVLKCYQVPVNQQHVVLCGVGLRSIIRFSQSVVAPSRGVSSHPRRSGPPQGCRALWLQRFLAESPWDDDTVIGRLQECLGPRLGHPEAVWVLDGRDFPKQGRKSVGVARQYCGRLGKVANCQAGMFLAYVSPLAGPWWTSGCICRRAGLRTKTGVCRRVCQRIGRPTGRRPNWRWRCCRGLGAAPSEGWLGCRRRCLRDVAVIPRGTGGAGDALRPGRTGWFYSVAAGARADQSGIPGPGDTPQPQAGERVAADNAGARRCYPGRGLA